MLSAVGSEGAGYFMKKEKFWEREDENTVLSYALDQLITSKTRCQNLNPEICTY